MKILDYAAPTPLQIVVRLRLIEHSSQIYIKENRSPIDEVQYVQEVVTLQKKYSNIFASEN